MKKIGFSTGCFFEYLSTIESLNILKKEGLEVVEVVAYREIKEDWINDIFGEGLPDFEYVSLHAPNVSISNGREMYSLFKKIERINKLRKLDLVVFHPDKIWDFDIFKNVSFKVGFENLDIRGNGFKTTSELLNLVNQTKFRYILDVSHAYSNDPSLETFCIPEHMKKYVGEIHLSGYLNWHDPLFKTKQEEIIEFIKNFDIPIIVESILNPNEMVKEKNYVESVLFK